MCILWRGEIMGPGARGTSLRRTWLGPEFLRNCLSRVLASRALRTTPACVFECVLTLGMASTGGEKEEDKSVLNVRFPVELPGELEGSALSAEDTVLDERSKACNVLSWCRLIDPGREDLECECFFWRTRPIQSRPGRSRCRLFSLQVDTMLLGSWPMLALEERRPPMG